MTLRAAFLEVWGTILLGLALLAGFVIAVGKLQKWLRARAGAALGLALVPGPKPFSELEAAKKTLLQLFNQGAHPGALRGVVHGVDTVVFDYDIVFRSGFHSSPVTTHQTVAAFRLSSPAPLEFLLEARPRREWSKENEKADADSEFRRRYHSRTQQPDALRRLLTPQTLASLTELAAKESWTFWADDGWLAVYRQKHRVSLRKLRAFLDKAEAMAALVSAPPTR
jgi:hypothetical protein